MLKVSSWKRRSDVYGKWLVIPLGFPVKNELDWHERYYTENAPTTCGVRDGVSKARRLPISQLFAHYVVQGHGSGLDRRRRWQVLVL